MVVPACSGTVAVYRVLTSAASPCLLLHLLWRRRRGLEHQFHLPERLGQASIARPPGPLLWFHAVSVGEAMAALPIIKRCTLMRPSLNILLTTSTVASYAVMQQILPAGVLCQFSPVDTPAAVESFLSHWHPEAGIFMESELWPNLMTSASLRGIKLALLNARMSSRSYDRWRLPIARHLVKYLLSMFSLISPLSTEEAIKYQIVGASPTLVHFAGNLKHAVEAVNSCAQENAEIAELRLELGDRPSWIAASTHPGEEDVVVSIHMALRQTLSDLVTIIAPRHPERGHNIALKLQQQGLDVAMRSRGDFICSLTDIYIVDTIGELKLLYEVSPVAFIGGSLFKGMAGHNLAEAAIASCAVLTGTHIGHFSQMVADFHQVSRLSVRQVSGKEELQNCLQMLLTDAVALQSCRDAARHASEVCARGVVTKVWKLLELFVLRQVFGQEQSPV